MARTRGRHPDAVRITTVAESRQAEIAGRQRRYVLSMTIRTLCFIGAILASVAGIGWLWPILIVAALILPYVAVVMANARHTRGEVFDPTEMGGEYGDRPPELGPGPDHPQEGAPRG